MDAEEEISERSLVENGGKPSLLTLGDHRCKLMCLPVFGDNVIQRCKELALNLSFGETVVEYPAVLQDILDVRDGSGLFGRMNLYNLVNEGGTATQATITGCLDDLDGQEVSGLLQCGWCVGSRGKLVNEFPFLRQRDPRIEAQLLWRQPE